VAREVWKRLAPMYVRLGLLTEVDGEAFTALCEASAALTRIRRAIRKDGYKVLSERQVVKVGKGDEEVEVAAGIARANPLMNLQRDALNMLRFWCHEFGVTPSSRGKINVPGGGKKKNIEEDFLDG
jgi:P27 family predicted phage terminase small subunit